MNAPPSRTAFALWAAVAGMLAALCIFTGMFVFRSLRAPESQSPSAVADVVTFQSEAAPREAEKPVPGVPAPVDARNFSASNTVNIRPGQVSPDDGLLHLAEERDGRTTVETLDGVPCVHHDRRPGTKSFGYVYFVVHPTFKRAEPQAVRVEVEYLVRAPTLLRLQYDAMEGETHRRYKSALASGPMVRVGGNVPFTSVRGTNAWQTATFRLTDAIFMNSQNGGADFRFEVAPPEVYIRRVSVTREGGAKDGAAP